MITSRSYPTIGVTTKASIKPLLDYDNIIIENYVKPIYSSLDSFSWTSIQFGFYSLEVDFFILDDEIAIVNPYIVYYFSNIYKLSLINILYQNGIHIGDKVIKTLCEAMGEQEIKTLENYVDSDLYQSIPHHDDLADIVDCGIKNNWLLFGHYYNQKKFESRYNYLLKSNPISIQTQSDYQSAKSAIIKRSWWNYNVDFECYDIEDKRYLFVEGRLYWEINKKLIRDNSLEIISFGITSPIPPDYLEKIERFKKNDKFKKNS